MFRFQALYSIFFLDCLHNQQPPALAILALAALPLPAGAVTYDPTSSQYDLCVVTIQLYYHMLCLWMLFPAACHSLFPMLILPNLCQSTHLYMFRVLAIVLWPFSAVFELTKLLCFYRLACTYSKARRRLPPLHLEFILIGSQMLCNCLRRCSF
jgi:hypothetical protein